MITAIKKFFWKLEYYFGITQLVKYCHIAINMIDAVIISTKW